AEEVALIGILDQLPPELSTTVEALIARENLTLTHLCDLITEASEAILRRQSEHNPTALAGKGNGKDH
ncbi:unnamed protein product, partial [Amoebophrya sp. A120]